MDPDDIAPMIVFVTLIVTTGGVLVLRPIVKQLAAYLHALTQQKQAPAVQPDLSQIRDLIGNVESRLHLLEERQNFYEALLASRPDALVLQSGPKQEMEKDATGLERFTEG